MAVNTVEVLENAVPLGGPYVVTEVTGASAFLDMIVVTSDGNAVSFADGHRLRPNESDSSFLSLVTTEVNDRIETQLDDWRALAFPEGLETESVDMAVGSGVDAGRFSSRVVATEGQGLLLRSSVAINTQEFTGAGKGDWTAVGFLYAVGSTLVVVVCTLSLLHGRSKVPGSGKKKHRPMFDDTFHQVRTAVVALPRNSSEEIAFARAQGLVRDADQNWFRNVIELVSRAPGDRSRAVYLVITSPAYLAAVFMTTVGFSLLLFWETPPLTPAGREAMESYPRALFAFHTVFVLALGVDLILMLWVQGFKKRSRKQAFQRASLPSTTRLLLLGLYGLFLFDWLWLCAGERYRATNDPSETLLVLSSPCLSAPARPFWLVLRLKPLRQVVRNFVQSIFYAKQLLVVGASFVAVAAVITITLLSRADLPLTLGRTFADWRSGVLMSFVLVTGENLVDVMYAADGMLRRSIVVGLTLCGCWLLVSLIISHFEMQHRERKKATQRTADQRSLIGAMAAYAVLQRDADPGFWRRFLTLMGATPDTLTFVEALRDADDAEAGIDRGMDPEGLQASTFCTALEVMRFRSLLEYSPPLGTTRSRAWTTTRGPPPPLPSGSSRLALLNRSARAWLLWVLSGKRYRHSVRLKVLLNIWGCFLIGTLNADLYPWIFKALVVFPVLHVAETLVRLWAMGHRGFVLGFDPSDPFAMFARRADAVLAVAIVALSLALWLLDYSLREGALVFAIPCVRLFTASRTNMTTIVGLGLAMRSLRWSIVLLLVFVYLYAGLCNAVYAGRFRYLSDYDLSGDANFDTMTSSVSTMFQVLVGEGWNDVFVAGLESFGAFSVPIFVSYVTIFSLLLVNLLIGMVTEAYGAVHALHGRLQFTTVRSEQQLMLLLDSGEPDARDHRGRSLQLLEHMFWPSAPSSAQSAAQKQAEMEKRRLEGEVRQLRDEASQLRHARARAESRSNRLESRVSQDEKEIELQKVRLEEVEQREVELEGEVKAERERLAAVERREAASHEHEEALESEVEALRSAVGRLTARRWTSAVTQARAKELVDLLASSRDGEEVDGEQVLVHFDADGESESSGESSSDELF